MARWRIYLVFDTDEQAAAMSAARAAASAANLALPGNPPVEWHGEADLRAEAGNGDGGHGDPKAAEHREAPKTGGTVNGGAA